MEVIRGGFFKEERMGSFGILENAAHRTFNSFFWDWMGVYCYCYNKFTPIH